MVTCMLNEHKIVLIDFCLVILGNCVTVFWGNLISVLYLFIYFVVLIIGCIWLPLSNLYWYEITFSWLQWHQISPVGKYLCLVWNFVVCDIKWYILDRPLGNWYGMFAVYQCYFYRFYLWEEVELLWFGSKL